MKITFIGGGSLRLIPILRGVMTECPQIFDDAELRFFDLHSERAEAVITLIQNAPEFRNVKKCRFVCPETLDEALKDIDICYLTMGIRREPQTVLAAHLCSDCGLISTDQLSLTGAFWGIQLGKTVYSIAERLSKLSPDVCSSYIGRKTSLHHEAFCTTSRSIIRLYLTFQFYLLTFRFIRHNQQVAINDNPKNCHICLVTATYIR